MSQLNSREPFLPHSYEQLLQLRAFDPPLPEKFYQGLLGEYDALDVVTSRITYDSHGHSVTGLMCAPRQPLPRSHPILLYNRGGFRNFGMLTLLSVIRSMAPFAAEGYLVYASNYRGNDGSEGTDEFGGAEVNDVLALLDIARNNPAWDGKNAFIVGHSRGGMMTYLTLKAGAVLNAAVSIAGIATLFAEGKPASESRFKHLITDDRPLEEALAARSALCWPEVLATPLLLLHGTADDKVDQTHSLELAKALSQVGHNPELEIYETGNHALVRQWDQVLERIKAFLKGHRA